MLARGPARFGLEIAAHSLYHNDLDRRRYPVPVPQRIESYRDYQDQFGSY
jgi:hypothetical protein